MSKPTKEISIKFIGSNRSAEAIQLSPGTTVADVLRQLGLGAGFSLVDPNDPDALFNPTDDLFSRVKNGVMLAATAMVDAGVEQNA